MPNIQDSVKAQEQATLSPFQRVKGIKSPVTRGYKPNTTGSVTGDPITQMGLCSSNFIDKTRKRNTSCWVLLIIHLMHGQRLMCQLGVSSRGSVWLWGSKIQAGPFLDFIGQLQELWFSSSCSTSLGKQKKKKERKGDRREKSGGGLRTRWVSGKSLKASAKCNGSWHTQVLWSILPSHKVFQLQMTRPGALCLLAWACWRWPASSAPTSPASARGIIDLTEGWG